MYSVRPLSGAPVSTPLDWHEVGPDLDPKSFTIRSVPERMQRRGDDPLLPVLALEPDLASALTQLGARLRSA
jgi:bifunctional non-homologous end joining protein LigD